MSKRIRKVFDCDRSLYLAAKQKADKEGLHFSRMIERAVGSALQEKPAKGKQAKQTYPLMFRVDPELYARAKEQAHREGVYLARWLEQRLQDYIK